MALALEERTVKALEAIAKAAEKSAATVEELKKIIETKLEAVAEEIATLNATVEKKGD